MSLHQVDLGTTCTVLSTGEEGTLKKIYHYPTRFEVETADGCINHYTSHEIDLSGITRLSPNYQSPEFPTPETHFANASYAPFVADCQIQRFFSTTSDILWRAITSLQLLNVWMPRVQRALPVVETDRYVTQYSFDRIDLKAGTLFKIRPFSLSTYFNCKIVSIEKEKELVLEMRFSPLYTEQITISLESHEKGVLINYKKHSKGLFSFLSLFKFYKREAQTLITLESIVPKVDFTQSDEEGESGQSGASQFGGFGSREDYIAYAINMGMEGNMDFINSISEKPIRGMAKAGVVKAKRTGVIPPKPEKPEGGAAQASGSAVELSADDIIAIAVNKALDGDKEYINGIDNKATRGKAKALVVKINRGKAERPPMPEIQEMQPVANDAPQESDEELINRLVADGVAGNIDEINALENKVLRGKIKSAVVKAKRAKS